MITWTLSKLKTFVLQNTSIRKYKTKPQIMRKIFIYHKVSRELVSTTYKKKTLQLKSKTNIKKKEKKLGKGLDRYFSKENIQTANKHMKRCSYNLSLGKYNLKPTWDTATPIWIAIFKKTDHIKCWWAWGETGILLRCCEIVKK